MYVQRGKKKRTYININKCSFSFSNNNSNNTKNKTRYFYISNKYLNIQRDTNYEEIIVLWDERRDSSCYACFHYGCIN